VTNESWLAIPEKAHAFFENLCKIKAAKRQVLFARWSEI
jgi:hypothetical protein